MFQAVKTPVTDVCPHQTVIVFLDKYDKGGNGRCSTCGLCLSRNAANAHWMQFPNWKGQAAENVLKSISDRKVTTSIHRFNFAPAGLDIHHLEGVNTVTPAVLIAMHHQAHFKVICRRHIPRDIRIG